MSPTHSARAGCVHMIALCCDLIDNEAILFSNQDSHIRWQKKTSAADRLDRHPWYTFFINHLPSVILCLRCELGKASRVMNHGSVCIDTEPRQGEARDERHLRIQLSSSLIPSHPLIPRSYWKLMMETILIRQSSASFHPSCTTSSTRHEKTSSVALSPWMSIHVRQAKLFHFSSSAKNFIEPDLLPECTYWRWNEWEI